MTNGNTPSAAGKRGPRPFWRVFWLDFLVASLAYAWYSFYVPSNDVAWAHDFDEARTLAAESDRPLLLFFTAEWCVPCRVMKREVFADPAGTVLDYEVGRIGKTRFLDMLDDLGAVPTAAAR